MAATKTAKAAKAESEPEVDLDKPEDEPEAEAEEKKPEPEAEKKPEPEEQKPDAEEEKKPRDPGRTAAIALVTVAAVCAAWFGWSWYGAAHDDSLAYSRERDEVLRVGEQAVQNLNTLDHRSVGAGLKVWQDSTTSDLYQSIVQGRPAFEKAVKDAKTVTTAKVLDAAVTEFDDHAGKASVIVALQVTVAPPKGDPAVKKSRMMGQLTRTASGWKLSALGLAPGSSGS